MRLNITYIIFVFTLMFIGIETYSQKCSKKKLADKDMRLAYDYRGQSLFVELSNGDSTQLNVVLYSKQNYRIFVVGEQKLGNIEYEVIVPRKEFVRIIKAVNPKKVQIYKKDPSGFYLYDPSGNRISIGTETIMDTTWTRETSAIKELVYDSRTSENPYWLATPNKTQLITIKVHVAPSDKIQTGCIGLYVGREYVSTYQFRR